MQLLNDGNVGIADVPGHGPRPVIFDGVAHAALNAGESAAPALHFDEQDLLHSALDRQPVKQNVVHGVTDTAHITRVVREFPKARR